MSVHRARDCDESDCPRHPEALFHAHGMESPKEREDQREEERPLSPEEEAEAEAELAHR